MDLTWTWLLLGAAAFILVLINLIRAALKKHQRWQVLLFASLSCGVLTVLRALQAVYYWTQKEHWDDMTDVVPTLTRLCTIAVALGIILNFLALWLHLRAGKTRKEVKTDGKS